MPKKQLKLLNGKKSDVFRIVRYRSLYVSSALKSMAFFSSHFLFSVLLFSTLEVNIKRRRQHVDARGFFFTSFQHREENRRFLTRHLFCYPIDDNINKMSMNQLQTELLKLIAMGKSNQDTIIKRLDRLYEDFGALSIKKWRHAANKGNSLLHEFVEKEMPDVIRHLVSKHQFDINVRRGSDGLTPLQLALENDNSEISDVLEELGAIDIQTEDVSTWLSDDDKKKTMNIVWMDLEMTSLEDPDIMECAVIITDKDLHELDKGKLYMIVFHAKSRLILYYILR